MTPDELAERYVNNRIDAIGETIAGILLLQAPILSELGGEFVEDRIHDAVKWHYAPARDLGGGMHEVTATASVGFKATIALASASVAFSLPFDMLIDHDAQLVARMNPNIAAASLDLDAPMLEQTTEAVDKAVDATTERASEAAEQASEKISEIGAAREAGVPERVLSILEKSSDERGSLERSLARRALDAVGLSDACGDLGE